MTLAIPPALRAQFHFDAGQYVTVRRFIDGREERRTYSIVTPPGSSALRFGVREQTRRANVASELATQLRPGDRLDVGTPIGRFRTAVDPARARSYVAFAAGSGITPVLSLAADILVARAEQPLHVLIYGNRSMARTMFLEDTLALKNRHLGRFARLFRDEPRAAADRAAQRAHRCRQGRAQLAARNSRDFHGGRVFRLRARATWSMRCAAAHQAAERRAAPVRFERFVAAPAPAAFARPGGAAAGEHRHAACAAARGAVARSRSSWTAGAAAFPMAPAGRLGARGGRTRRASNCRSRAAPASAPPAARRSISGRSRDGAQHRARALGDRCRFRALLPGPTDHGDAGTEL